MLVSHPEDAYPEGLLRIYGTIWQHSQTSRPSPTGCWKPWNACVGPRTRRWSL